MVFLLIILQDLQRLYTDSFKVRCRNVSSVHYIYSHLSSLTWKYEMRCGSLSCTLLFRFALTPFEHWYYTASLFSFLSLLLIRSSSGWPCCRENLVTYFGIPLGSFLLVILHGSVLSISQSWIIFCPSCAVVQSAYKYWITMVASRYDFRRGHLVSEWYPCYTIIHPTSAVVGTVSIS